MSATSTSRFFITLLTPAQRRELPFSDAILAEARSVLLDNESRAIDERFDFEHLISLLTVRIALFSGGGTLSERLASPAGSRPEVLRCLLALLGLLVASRVGLTPSLKANRNYWYRVNDSERAIAFQAGLHSLVKTRHPTFVSFNYDGILEAFLDIVLGATQFPEFLYLTELSHAVPMVMPEHVAFRVDTRDLTRLRGVARVLKPHGSIHFFRLRPEIEGVFRGSQIVALHPRLDLRFNPDTGQRDIPYAGFWEFADPVPFIVPPVLNKERLLNTEYFKEVLRLTVEVLQSAKTIICLGFSLPASDLHLCAAFDLVRWQGKRLALCFRGGPQDSTLANWRRVARGADIHVLSDAGIPTNNASAIAEFWQSVFQLAAD